MSYVCVNCLGYSYKKLSNVPIKSQRQNIQEIFEESVTFISNENLNRRHFNDESSVIEVMGPQKEKRGHVSCKRLLQMLILLSLYCS